MKRRALAIVALSALAACTGHAQSSGTGSAGDSDPILLTDGATDASLTLAIDATAPDCDDYLCPDGSDGVMTVTFTVAAAAQKGVDELTVVRVKVTPSASDGGDDLDQPTAVDLFLRAPEAEEATTMMTSTRSCAAEVDCTTTFLLDATRLDQTADVPVAVTWSVEISYQGDAIATFTP